MNRRGRGLRRSSLFVPGSGLGLHRKGAGLSPGNSPNYLVERYLIVAGRGMRNNTTLLHDKG
jgi:hypothetical protein